MPEIKHYLNLSEPLPKQKEFLQLKKNIRLYSGAFGAGKSFTICYAAILHSLLNPYNRFLICRKRMTDLRNTTMKTFFEILPPHHKIVRQWHKSSSCLTLINGSEIWFGGFDTNTKWASAELGGWAMDEATDFKEDDFNMLISRLRKRNIKNHLGLLACNPSTKMHWIYKTFFESHDNNYGYVETVSHDNKYLPSSTLERYELWKKTNPDYYMRYIKGIWGILEGLVYKSFDPTYNIKEFEINENWTFYRSIDWGYTNPFVCLFIALDNDDNIYVFDEIYITQKILSELAPDIMSRYRQFNFLTTYADPSDATNIAEFINYGIDIQRANNNQEAGIRKTTEMLPKLFIHPRCINTIKEFQSYSWDSKQTDRNKPEKPLKFNDHAMDAMRYFIYTHFYSSIEPMGFNM